jgi:hypothetical protein
MKASERETDVAATDKEPNVQGLRLAACVVGA